MRFQNLIFRLLRYGKMMFTETYNSETYGVSYRTRFSNDLSSIIREEGADKRQAGAVCAPAIQHDEVKP